MMSVTAGPEIEIETGQGIDLGSFLMRLVTAGHEIESELGLSFFAQSNLAFDPMTRRDLALSRIF